MTILFTWALSREGLLIVQKSGQWTENRTACSQLVLHALFLHPSNCCLHSKGKVATRTVSRFRIQYFQEGQHESMSMFMYIAAASWKNNQRTSGVLNSCLLILRGAYMFYASVRAHTCLHDATFPAAKAADDQPVGLAGLDCCWFVKKHCWLVWCERKILFWLKIYDRLRAGQPSRTGWTSSSHHHLPSLELWWCLKCFVFKVILNASTSSQQ